MNVSDSGAFKNKRILFTGASGFLGRAVLRRLLAGQAKVDALGLPDDPAPDEFKQVKNLKTHFLSLLEFKKVKTLATRLKPEMVLHMAAMVNLDRSFQVAKSCVETNIQGTLNLLEAVRESAVRSFVFISTAEVYGKGATPFQEGQRELPPSPYAVSKLAGESLCRIYSSVHQIPVTILRLSTCYGPGQGQTRIIPSVALACLNRQPIRVNSVAPQRDFIYVEDAAKAIVSALAEKKAVGKTLNIGSPQTVSIKKIIAELCKITQSYPPVIEELKKVRAQESGLWRMDNKLAKKILSWSPETSLVQGLTNTVRWLEKNKIG